MHPLRVMALYANDKLSYRIVSTDKEWRKRGASCVSGKCVYCKKTPATRWHTRSAYDRTEDGGVYRSTSSGRVGWARRVGVSGGRVEWACRARAPYGRYTRTTKVLPTYQKSCFPALCNGAATAICSVASSSRRRLYVTGIRLCTGNGRGMRCGNGDPGRVS